MSARHVYVHVPFCRRRCLYCDFSIAVRRVVPAGHYLAALAAEWARVKHDGAFDTLYLGGGTPSLLEGAGVAALAAILGARRDLAEFTIEANPDDVTPDAARAWVHCGVNRLSLGAQSFDPRVLAWMHRSHGPAAVGEAVAVARRAGIANISLDLIFALPEVLARRLDDDLDRVLDLGPEHVSLYGLTVEPGTPLGRRVGRGDLAPAPDERYEEEYLRIQTRLAAEGYRFYEVSNAARPGYEAVHNRAYWRLAPYLGLGPAAHSFDGTSRWWNEGPYARWRSHLARGESPVAGREILAPEQRRLEALYLGLRTAEGAVLPEPLSGALAATLSSWVAAGWAKVEDEETSPADAQPERAEAASPGDGAPAAGAAAARHTRIRLTPRGWLRLDELAASL